MRFKMLEVPPFFILLSKASSGVFCLFRLWLVTIPVLWASGQLQFLINIMPYGDQWLQQMIPTSPPPPQKCLTICIWSIIAPSSCNMLVWFWQLYGSHCVKEMEVNCSILLIANDECKRWWVRVVLAGCRWRRCQGPLMNQAPTNRRTSTPQGSKVHA